MKVSSLLLCFILLSITFVKSTIKRESIKEGRFYQINNPELFHEIVESSNQPFFLKFYQYKRLQCESVETVWKEFADKNTHINFAEINCKDAPELQNLFGITSFPTFKFCPGEKVKEQCKTFKGLRTINQFEMFASEEIEKYKQQQFKKEL